MIKNIIITSLISAGIAVIIVLIFQMAHLVNSPLSTAIGAGIGTASAVVILNMIRKNKEKN